MSREYVYLAPGNILTVTPVGSVQVYLRGDSPADFLNAAKSWGPYLVEREFVVDGDATVATSQYTTAYNAYVYPNAGAPADAVQATASINPTGDDNALTYTARDYGAGGNSLQIEYLDPSTASQSLTVTVDRRQKISVSLATNGSSVITSTAAQVKTAIEADAEANDLVTVAINTADTGVADDGSGVVTAIALTAFSGGTGTGIGLIPPGGKVIDTTNGVEYVNTGTQAVPVWEEYVPASGGVATVSFAVAAGAANVCIITGTLKDAAGATIAASRPLILYISEAATGIGITADSYSTGASVTTGTQLVALTANKAWLINTHTDSTFAISITDTVQPADQYLVAVSPVTGLLSVSGATSTNWGA